MAWKLQLHHDLHEQHCLACAAYPCLTIVFLAAALAERNKGKRPGRGYVRLGGCQQWTQKRGTPPDSIRPRGLG